MPDGSLTIEYCVQSLGAKTWPEKMTNDDIKKFLMMQANNRHDKLYPGICHGLYNSMYKDLIKSSDIEKVMKSYQPLFDEMSQMVDESSFKNEVQQLFEMAPEVQ